MFEYTYDQIGMMKSTANGRAWCNTAASLTLYNIYLQILTVEEHTYTPIEYVLGGFATINAVLYKNRDVYNN